MTAYRYSSTKELLRYINTCKNGLPVAQMEELIRRGRQIIPDIEDELDKNRSDRLLYMVLLGEIKTPKSISLLERFLKIPDNGSCAIVATESLAKYGREALRLFFSNASPNTPRYTRFLAYAGMSYTELQEARRFLINALNKDAELIDIISYSLARFHNLKDIYTLYNCYKNKRITSYERIMIEKSICIIHHGHIPKNPIKQNWRTRYRKIASNYIFLKGEPDFFLMANRAGLKNIPVPKDVDKTKKAYYIKELEEILSVSEFMQEKCLRCGDRISYPTGIGVCSENAYSTLLTQSKILKDYVASGITDIYEALDDLENSWQETDYTSFARATFLWLAEQGVTNIYEGVKLLQSKKSEIISKYRTGIETGYTILV
jgi:hypothetical protein